MVEWKKFGEVCKVHTGIQLNRSDMLDEGLYPVVNGGREYSGYTDKYNEEKESITISQGGESAGFVNWIDVNFWAGAHCYVIEENDNYNKRFLYHTLKNKEREFQISKQGAGIPGLNRNTLYNQIIPLPSTSEQLQVVEILDTFTNSIENLKGQIALRRKQYEYYRDQLLDLEGKEGVEMKSLGSFSEIGTGSSNTQDELDSGKYPFFVRSQKIRWKNEYEFDETAVITSGDGVGVGKVLHYYEGKYALHQRAYRIRVNADDVVPKFLFYFMQKDFYSYIMSNAYAASVTSVRKPMLINYPIPIPSFSEQSRIVSILDTFESSVVNLEQQLALREKQYEYYRNKLLTFE